MKFHHDNARTPVNSKNEFLHKNFRSLSVLGKTKNIFFSILQNCALFPTLLGYISIYLCYYCPLIMTIAIDVLLALDSNNEPPRNISNRIRRLGISRTNWDATKAAHINRQCLPERARFTLVSRYCPNVIWYRPNISRPRETDKCQHPLEWRSLLNPNAQPFVPASREQVPASDMATDRLPIVLNINARSVANKMDLLNMVLTDTNADVACVTETWLTSSNRDVVLAQLSPDYQAISTERSEGRGGGTMIVVKRNYASQPKRIAPQNPKQLSWCGRPSEEQVLETTIARLQPRRLPRGYSTCIVVCAYLPEWSTAGQRTATFQLTQQIDDTIADIATNNKPLLIIAGDLNGSPTSSICSALDCHLIESSATRRDKKLDVIMTNAPKCYFNQTIGPLGASDHDIQLVRAPLAHYRATKPPPTKIQIRTGRLSDTVQEIREINWTALGVSERNFYNRPRHNAIENIQMAFDTTYSAVLAAQDICQPYKTVTVVNDKEWMTPDIKKAIVDKQRLFRRNKLVEWKLATTKLRSIIWNRKKAFYNNLEIGKVDWWRHVNKARAPTQATANTDLVNELSEGFYSVWSGSKQPSIDRFICKSPTNAPQLFNYNNIGATLGSLRRSAAGPDELSGVLLKAAKLELVDHLVPLFNSCLAWSYVPFQWRNANITPVAKVAHPSKWSDYRPISLTSTMSKVFERIVAKFLLDLMGDKLKSNKQYGFLPGRSTMDAIAQVIEDFSVAKEKRDAVLAIFFDFSKAFDLVDHEILLQTLEKLKIPTWLISWIASYLSNRRQRVKISGHLSEWKAVEAGVIQGSVLGPILFLLFIMDLNDALPPGIDIQKYADDILAYLVGIENINGSLPQQVADAVHKWCIEKKMRLNVDKCKMMLFCNGSTASPPAPIYISNVPLEPVSSYKYLGVEINSRLDWDAQWQKVRSKTKCLPFLLKRLKRLGYKQSILVAVYRSLGLSHFAYSAPLLTSVSIRARQEIESFQRRMYRIINITPDATLKLNLPDIPTVIDTTCRKLLERILSETSHPLTSKLRRTAKCRGSLNIKPALAKTKAYSDSFVQKFLRVLRDGQSDLYTNNNASVPRQTIVDSNAARATRAAMRVIPHLATVRTRKTLEAATCELCGFEGKSKAGIAIHKKGKKCATLQSTRTTTENNN